MTDGLHMLLGGALVCLGVLAAALTDRILQLRGERHNSERSEQRHNSERSEQRQTIEDAIKPFLVQRGFVERSRKGRVATEAGMKHLRGLRTTV